MTRKFIYILLLLVCSNCTFRQLSDSELLTFATTAYDKSEKMNTREALGQHNKMIVVAEYPCGDICPYYTKRIIHYDISIENCSEIIGVQKDISIFKGRSGRIKSYCIPNILHENWDKVIF